VFNASLAYTFSDEINVLFTQFNMFNRRLEKINSIMAGFTSSLVQNLLSKRFMKDFTVSFDCRVIPLTSLDRALEYLTWRQNEAYRNCFNAYAYYTLISRGNKSPTEASDKLRRMKIEEIKILLSGYNVNPQEIPKWQYRGILVHWEKYLKKGFNPKDGRYETAERRRVKVDWSPPHFGSKDGKTVIRKLLGIC